MEFDLIIIGAGINGAGIARDAAMRGLKVLLLDKGDICSGTSSWSTRLIHGGLRYLEHGELGLVRESLRERETLLRIAPHLVRPLPILIPIYSNRSRGPWTIRAGMLAYDLLSYDRELPGHSMLAPSEVLERAPGLSASGLQGAAIYYDALVEFAERLVLENALSALEHGATILTYSEVVEFSHEDGFLKGVKFKNADGEHVHVNSQLVINASGPWVDRVLAGSGFLSKQLIGGTKGSHVIVARFPGAPSTAIYVEAEQDRRPIFIIPWSGKYLIGTTDSRYEGCLDRVEIDNSEIRYLLSEVNRLIPAAELSCDSILFTYSGVRPLPATDDEDEQGITRRHFIHEHSEPRGLISLIGGKLTTYRSLAEQTVDVCLRRLGMKARRCTTAEALLPGAQVSAGQGQDRLTRVYGSRTAQVSQLAKEDERLLEVFDEETGAIAAEVVFAFRHELARTLIDALMRRTMVGLNSTCGLNAVEAAAQIGCEYFGWSRERKRREVAEYRSYVERFHPRALTRDVGQ